MKPLIFVSICSALFLSGCALQENACENVVVAAEELQQCKQLGRQIEQAKGTKNVVMRSELERRYQEDCVEIRYYRDSKQDAICANKEQIKQAEKRKAAKLSEK